MMMSSTMNTWTSIRTAPSLAKRRYSTMPMRAAAPPPTALNSETSCGIAVIFTIRDVYSPRPPPIAMPMMMIAQVTTLMPSAPGASSSSARIRTAVAAMARVMPAADSRLPLRAVAGEFIWMRPSTKVTAPASQASRTMISMASRAVID